MTKRDYELIAQVLRHAKEMKGYEDEEWPIINEFLGDLVWLFSEELSRENPKFSVEKFTEACL